MSIWVLQQTLTPEEEGAITTRTHVQLPYENLPDLTHVRTEHEATRLLRMLHPGEPPEAIGRMHDKFWALHSGIQEEDVIAIPMPNSKKLALAQVAGPYEYRVGPNGSDLHFIPVTWPRKPVPMRKFYVIRTLLAKPGMTELVDREGRIIVLGKLPHGYNRFDKLSWVLVILTVLMCMRLVGRGLGFGQ